ERTHGYTSGRDQQLAVAFLETLANRHGIVADGAERDRNRSGLTNRRVQRVAVRGHDLRTGQHLVETVHIHELVTRCKNSYARLTMPPALASSCRRHKPDVS